MTEGRFEEKVDRTPGLGPWGDCHEWTGSRDDAGYGMVRLGSRTDGSRRMRRAHIVAWILTYGEPPARKPCVLHRCDNPPCVRLDHLFAGTKGENNSDRAKKGRSAAKLTDAQAEEIRMRVAGGQPQRSIAIEYGVSQSMVSLLVNRRRREVTP